MAVTPAGTPYVESSDNVADYPGVSLSLANHIDGLDGGKVLQVVSVTKTDTFSTTSTSFIDVTGLSVSITPRSASSKILVSYTVNVGADANRGQALRLMRDSTPILQGDAASSRTRASNFTFSDFGATYETSVMFCLSNQFLDSPASTSALAYKIQVGAVGEVNGTSIFVNRTSDDADAARMSRTTSTITAMEIGA